MFGDHVLWLLRGAQFLPTDHQSLKPLREAMADPDYPGWRPDDRPDNRRSTRRSARKRIARSTGCG